MPIFSTIDLFACIAMILLGWVIAFFIGKQLALSSGRITAIYLWHTLFSGLYLYILSISNGGDAIFYYARALSEVLQMGLGSDTVVLVTAFGTRVLNLGFYATNFMFQIFGAVGLLFLDAAIQKPSKSLGVQQTNLEKYIIFIPSLSFWSSGLGKDSLAIMCIGMILWAAQSIGKRVMITIMALAALFCVRPHIATICGMAFLCLIVFDKRVAVITRLFFIPVVFVVFVFLLPIAAQFTGLGAGFDVVDLQKYIVERAEVTSIGGSAVDISSMNPPQRLLNYLLRPILPEARTPLELFSGIDNAIILVLLFGTIFTYFKKSIGGLVARENSEAFLLAFFVITWFMLGLTTANLGIAQRQKWMFLPALILIYIERKRRQNTNYSRQIYA